MAVTASAGAQTTRRTIETTCRRIAPPRARRRPPDAAICCANASVPNRRSIKTLPATRVAAGASPPPPPFAVLSGPRVIDVALERGHAVDSLHDASPDHAERAVRVEVAPHQVTRRLRARGSDRVVVVERRQRRLLPRVEDCPVDAPG